MRLVETMFSIFRGHIPDNAIRTTPPIALPAGAIAGVLAAAASAVGLIAATLAAMVWLAIRLI